MEQLKVPSTLSGLPALNTKLKFGLILRCHQMAAKVLTLLNKKKLAQGIEKILN